MNFRIEMTDGRVLIGVFLCTDRDANVILGNNTMKWTYLRHIELRRPIKKLSGFILGACSEYLKSNDGETEEPRVLGLVMVPGRHIVSIKIDDTMDTSGQKYYYEE